MTLAEFVSEFTVYKNKPLSKHAIKLQNKRGYLIRRKNECVIRYFLRYEHEKEYYRALCILFLPFRNEMQDIHLRDVEELYRENEDSIEFVRNKFEKYREIVNIIRNSFVFSSINFAFKLGTFVAFLK